tara:strand:- start:51 stop:776 length:726 start_codon:yes stop_codon:yes gene_type:complete
MDKPSFLNNLNNLEEFLINYNVEISYSNFLFAILLSTVLAYIIKLTYIKTSYSLNDKQHFTDIFIPLALVTTLVITVVKFSLALSLGLVGALSIVRFRAAIKEPEELVYLFFIIGIGLANGANQYLLSIIATFITISILYLRKIISDKKKTNTITDSSTNILQLQSNQKNLDLNKIILEMKDTVNYLKLKSLSIDKDNTQYNFWFDVDKEKLPIFLKKVEKISTENKEVSIQLYSRSGIYE